jgi:hypothetical protein
MATKGQRCIAYTADEKVIACTACSETSQCQSDPYYADAFAGAVECDVSTGACVSASCSRADAVRRRNHYH